MAQRRSGGDSSASDGVRSRMPQMGGKGPLAERQEERRSGRTSPRSNWRSPPFCGIHERINDSRAASSMWPSNWARPTICDYGATIEDQAALPILLEKTLGGRAGHRPRQERAPHGSQLPQGNPWRRHQRDPRRRRLQLPQAPRLTGRPLARLHHRRPRRSARRRPHSHR